MLNRTVRTDMDGKTAGDPGNPGLVLEPNESTGPMRPGRGTGKGKRMSKSFSNKNYWLMKTCARALILACLFVYALIGTGGYELLLCAVAFFVLLVAQMRGDVIEDEVI